MSRLDTMIRRMTAQRAGLAWAKQALGAAETGVPGDIVEVGLGAGRTYDYMREHFPDRKIWVIERVVEAHPDYHPPAELLLLGEAEDGLAKLAGADLALVSYDLGVGDPVGDPALAAHFAPAMIACLRKGGGLIVSTQPLPDHPELTAISQDEAGTIGRVFVYRR
ncbi:MAG: hypothetical protein MRY74_16615 [Neomegalonema sp.]|nr:hypothetical protein [Neomegalonema sp.]